MAYVRRPARGPRGGGRVRLRLLRLRAGELLVHLHAADREHVHRLEDLPREPIVFLRGTGFSFLRSKTCVFPGSMLVKLANICEKEVIASWLPYGLCLPSIEMEFRSVSFVRVTNYIRAQLP